MNTSKYRLTHNALLIAIMLTAGILIYSDTFQSPFLFDDDGFVVNDYAIRMTDLSLESIKTAALDGRPRHRYLPNISFAVNYYFGQLNPIGYHVVNLVIHLLTGIFLFLFIRLTLRIYPRELKNIGFDHLSNHGCRSEPCSQFFSWAWPTLTKNGQSIDQRQHISPQTIAFFAALLWIVQPVGSQAVTYICQRMASMVALFYILSLFLYIQGRMAMIGKPDKFVLPALCFAGSALAALCALATKENAGTLPLIILLYEWFFFQDLKLRWSRRQFVWAGFFIIVFCAAVIWYMGENPMVRLVNSYNRRDFTLIERVMTQWRIVIYYISLFLWVPPGRLNLDHDYPLSVSPLEPFTTLPAFFAIIALFILSVYAARKERLMAFAILWFFIAQATESTIIGIELIFEHRTYIPFMMVSLMFVLVVFRLLKGRNSALALLGALVLIFSAWTFQRNLDWQNPVTFWHDSAVKSPKKLRPHTDLGVALYDAGDIAGAIREYEKAIRINPDHADVHNNMGNALSRQGKTDAAVQSFSRALALNPKHTKARNNLANALMQQGDLAGAIRHFQAILERRPDHVEANINMGAALTRLGQIDAALFHYQAAIKSDSYNPEAHNNMGVLFVRKNMLIEARIHFKKALDLRPGYASAINNLRLLDEMQP